MHACGAEMLPRGSTSSDQSADGSPPGSAVAVVVTGGTAVNAAASAADANLTRASGHAQYMALALPPEATEECEDDEPLETKAPQPLRKLLERVDPLYTMLLKWSLGLLLVLFVAVVVFGIFYSGIAYHDGPCTGPGTGNGGSIGEYQCESPFGTILGAHNGVFGYSNCNSDYVADDDSFTFVHTLSRNGAGVVQAQLYAGLQWQCVEYARRYWIERGRPEPAYFGPVDGAADIWNETVVTAVFDSSKKLPLHRFPNGHSVMEGVTPPQPGDIIIYARDSRGDFPFGHVAVVVGVNGTHVHVAEQNWESLPWPGPFHNYSRAIPLVYSPTALTYTIAEPVGTVLGWMRYGNV